MIFTFVLGFVIGVPTGYQIRRVYTRRLWRLARVIRDKAKGLD